MNLISWILFDFASSLSAAAFLLYFSLWLVIDNHVPDIWYNLILVGSTLLIILTAPIFCSIADKTLNRLKYLKIVTIIELTASLGVSLGAMFLPYSIVNLWIIGLLFMIQLFSYQFSYSFYHPMLNAVSTSKNIGKISGIGTGISWIGAILGVAISLPFASGTFYLGGSHGHAQVFLPITIAFLIFSIPMLFLFKDSQTKRNISTNWLAEYKNFIANSKSVVKLPGVGTFLLSFFFFIDAILTTENNFPIYLHQVFGVSDTIKSALLALILITAGVGSMIVGRLADKIGHKRTLNLTLISWLVTFPLLSLAPSLILFAILLVVAGFLVGSTWTLARVVLINLTPHNQLNSVFGFYSIFERVSTFIGPVAWGLIVSGGITLGIMRYQVALASMTLFILIGFLIFRRISGREDR